MVRRVFNVLLSLRELTGYSVVSRDGKLGAIQDFQVNIRDWVIQNVIVYRPERPMSRYILVPAEAIGRTDLKSSIVLVKVSRDEAGQGRRTDRNGLPSVQQKMGSKPPDVWPTGSDWTTESLPLDSEPRGRKVARPLKSNEVQSAGPTRSRAQHLLGYRIVARDGDVGRLADLIVQNDTWAVNYLLVTTGDQRPALLAPCWVTSVASDESEIKVDLKRETIRKSPEFGPEVLKR
jgi:sporulation protein YlmC with PRC-barrel domain